MNALMARYLDGTLRDDEAGALLDALAADPRLEAEMRAYETILAAAADLPPTTAPPGFTDEVMERLSDDVRPAGPVPPLPHERGRRSDPTRTTWAVAATIVVMAAAAFTAGRMIPVSATTPADLATTQASAVVTPVAFGGATDGRTERFRLVRFAYIPRNKSPASVSLAGSFNDWNPVATPMQKDGDVWAVTLLLPAAWHEYMFVEDGREWITDPSASRTVNDGFGHDNAVLDITL